MNSEPAILLKARLANVRQDLGEVVGHLTPALLDWAPRPGMRTIAGQLVEIASTEVQILSRLRLDKRTTDEEARAIFGDCTSLPNLVLVLAKVRNETLEFVDGLTEWELCSPDPNHPDWFGWLGIAHVPRIEILRGIAIHESYHTGQLVSYLWARGDNPYEW